MNDRLFNILYNNYIKTLVDGKHIGYILVDRMSRDELTIDQLEKITDLMCQSYKNYIKGEKETFVRDTKWILNLCTFEPKDSNDTCIIHERFHIFYKLAEVYIKLNEPVYSPIPTLPDAFIERNELVDPIFSVDGFNDYEISQLEKLIEDNLETLLDPIANSNHSIKKAKYTKSKYIKELSPVIVQNFKLSEDFIKRHIEYINVFYLLQNVNFYNYSLDFKRYIIGEGLDDYINRMMNYMIPVDPVKNFRPTELKISEDEVDAYLLKKLL